MSKILFVSDIHIGIRYSYRVDLKTGLSERTVDFIKALERTVDFAIKEKIDIFVICGDLYDRVTIGPTLLRQVRERIWQKLLEHKIPIILIGGNHDSPQIIEKGSPYGEISIIPNSIAVRTPQIHKMKLNDVGEEIGFILLPYLTASQAVEYVEKVMGEEIERGQFLVRSQELFKEWIKRQVKSINTDIIIIVGHFYVKGSKIGVIPYPEQLPHEFVFKKEMIPLSDIDLAVFGHIHTHQIIDEKIVIPGSLERVDFGEIDEDKGFIIFDTTTKEISFYSNNPRMLVKKTIMVPNNIENPTDYVISQLPQNIDEAVVRIEIKISTHLKTKIITPKLHKPLEEKSFHYEIMWDTSERIKESIMPELILDPRVLFSEFVTETCKNFPHFEELKQKGLEILDKSLLIVEEIK